MLYTKTDEEHETRTSRHYLTFHPFEVIFRKKETIVKVLDLDMDYFMERIASTPLSVTSRLDEEEYGDSVWEADRVRAFLENNLGLSKESKIPGRVVRGHDESLYFWEELVLKGVLDDPFEVVHVDSHADLGLGCRSIDFLQGAFLLLPLDIRRKIKDYEFSDQNESINIGDYLLWAIAYKLISKITYCANPNGEKNDYLWETLKDFKENYIRDHPVKNYIQLKYNKEMDVPHSSDSEEYKRRYLEGAIKDPEVELEIIPTVELVKYNGEFDYAVLAQSPNYTPASADFIMDIFREYIIEV